jgi:WD40 repeat protein
VPESGGSLSLAQSLEKVKHGTAREPHEPRDQNEMRDIHGTENAVKSLSTDRKAILEQLARILSSPGFRRTGRSSSLLRFIVEQTIDGKTDRLKEYTLGSEALSRGASFDPRTDTIVRAEMSRLRVRLAEYYEREGRSDSLVFILPKGSYVPHFEDRAAPPDRSRTYSLRRWPLRIAMFAVLAASIVLTIIWSKDRAAPSAGLPLQRLDVELKSDGTLGSQVGTDAILSPDGARIVFVARDTNGLAHLYTRRLDQVDQADALQLPGTEGARGVFISPDGLWVGFWASGKVRKVSVDGGSPTILCSAGDLLGASWGDDGNIVLAVNPGKLWTVPASGRDARVLLDLSDSGLPVWPQVLPGSKSMVYTTLASNNADNATIEMFSFEDGKRRVLVRGGSYGRYLSNGYLVYVNQGALYAKSFDPERFVLGEAVPLLDDVSYSRTSGYAQFDVSRTGMLVYRRSDDGGRLLGEWIDRAGNSTPVVSTPGRYSWPRLSPDGHRLALSATESGASNIWIVDLGTLETRRLTTATVDHSGLMWWPDGRFLLFGGPGGMTWIDTERPDRSMPASPSHAIQIPGAATTAGRLAYAEMGLETGLDLWTVAVQAVNGVLQFGVPEPFLQTVAFEAQPSFSADGRWISYVSNESGTPDVYVKRIPDDGTKVRISHDGGNTPKWSPNGRELLYQTNDQHVMVTSYQVASGAFTVGPPRVWSPRTLADTGVLPNFDVDSSGQRIFALVPAETAERRQSPNHVTFIFNFANVVQRRAAFRR